MDVTRTVSRAQKRATGIDRIERAYLEHLIACDTPLFGLVRTKLGFLLLDKDGCAALLRHVVDPFWTQVDLISRWGRRTDQPRAITETGLRRMALDRSTPLRLKRMLKRHLPPGAVYLNVGQTNFNDRVIHATKGIEGARIVTYVHDTIPLDWPDTQTQKSRLRFKRFLNCVDRFSDIVLCNSSVTKTDILQHVHQKWDTDIHVLLPGLHDMPLGNAPVGPWTDRPYFITIGTIEPRKQIGFLLDLWSDFDGDQDPHLLICGQRGWMSDAIFERLDQHPRNVHELNDLSDPDMWALLSQSNGLLFPSLAEGFGYPAFEAAKLDIPVLCSPLPVFKELLKDYPIYAGESDRYSWRNNIEQLAQRRRGQGGEQNRQGAVHVPGWQAHFNQLFTLL
ncbi:glycosyltransferase [Marivita sp. S6314]|uniref:glycosyltransferase n=1 Tax=Marivita sp. S6314 TaxID=2926406 RepID=UPI001FF5E0DB|nr:glycosyltransferase [Marivita sp. S6314]MCK0150181.1 glycosyltransferase [Marivita sp. S6314]